MLYCCLQRCTSLREVTTGLMACQQKLLHLGLNYIPRRSTLSEANRNRTSDFFATVYQKLYKHHYPTLPDSRFQSIHKRLYIIDSTTISLFSQVMKGTGDIGQNGRKKGGAKAHVVVKADQNLPCFVMIKEGTSNDRDVFTQYSFPKGSIVVMDKGYNSYVQFDRWITEGVTFVTRLRETSCYEITESNEVSKSEHEAGVKTDCVARFGRPSNKSTKKPSMRLISFVDQQSGKEFWFITNDFYLKASTIAGIYKQRWQIELLFKRIKQHYPLRYFLGDNENAIKTQIWCTLIADLLIETIRKKLSKNWSYSNLAGMVKLHLMNYLHLLNFLNNPEQELKKYKEPPNWQLF